MKAQLLSCLTICGMMVSPVAAATQEAPALKVGDPAPALTVGKWIKGEPVGKLEAGKIYVLEFWATWCGPCVKAMPHVTALQKQFPELVFIGVNVWERAPQKVTPFVQKMGDKMDYRVVTDDVPQGSTDGMDGKMVTHWLNPAGVNAIPSSIVVGKDGRILWMGDPSRLDPVLTAVAAGKAVEQAPSDEPADEAGLEKMAEIIGADLPGVETLAALEALGKEHPKILPEIQRASFDILFHGIKDYEKAYQVAAKILETFKDQPDILGAIAWLMIEPNELNPSNPPLGLKFAEQALKASGGEDLEFLDLLARAHFEVGRAKAIEVTRKAVAVATEHAKFDADAEGDLEFAREMLDNYTNYDPHEPPNGANDDADEEKKNVPAEAAPTLKVGDPAPALTVGKWIKGEPVGKLEAGKIYVLEFWATWCGPCVQVIPHVTALQKRYPEMVFIGVNVWENDTGKIAPLINKLGDQMDYRVVLDDMVEGDEGGRDGKMATGWLKPAGMKAIPATVIVGKDGKILWMGHPAGLEPVLEAVAQGKPIE